MSDSFETPWTVAHQAPLSMRFPKQEYWNGLPFPSPRDLPNPGVEPTSPVLAGKFFTTQPPGKPILPVIYPQTQPLQRMTSVFPREVSKANLQGTTGWIPGWVKGGVGVVFGVLGICEN